MKRRRAPSETEIDDQVIADADVDDAWTKGVKVRGKGGHVSLPAGLARRAEFVARLHRKSVEQWLAKVVEERLDLEEAAFSGAKRELKSSAAKG